MNTPDHFAVNLSLPHLVAVTEPVLLETAVDGIDMQVPRGIYAFTSFKEARHFTTIVNDAKEETVAFRFKRGQDGENEND